MGRSRVLFPPQGSPLLLPHATVAEYATRWLDRHAHAIRASSARTYTQALTRYIIPALGTLPLTDLTRGVVHEALAGLADRGLNIHVPYTVLAMLLNDAVDAGLIPANPVLGLQRRLAPKRQSARSYDRRQLALFLTLADDMTPQVGPILHVMAEGGLRIGEALALHRHDIDPQTHQLRVERTWLQVAELGPTKSGQARHVDIPRDLTARLEDVRGSPDGWLFPGGEGNTCRGHSSTAKLMAEVVRAGKLPPLSPHGLRHTAASLWIESGADAEWVRVQLGHQSIATTQIYMSHRRPPRPAFLDR